MPPQVVAADAPAVVAGHRVGPRMHDGGLGPVHLAHVPGGQPVALMLVRAAAAARDGFATAFHRDAQAAGQVRGPALAQVLGSGREGERYWLAAAHEPVRQLAGAGPLPTRTVLRLVAGIAEALRVLHHAGVVHGDLRPAHVLLAAEGPRLKDYGLAGIPGFAPEAGEGPAFVTPEQAAGQLPAPASDVFALGQIAAYAAIGVPPFGADADAARTRVRQEEPDLNELPGELREIVTRCLIKDPVLRPSLAQVIAMCAQAAPASAHPTPWLPPHLLRPPTPPFSPAPAASATRAAPAGDTRTASAGNAANPPAGTPQTITQAAAHPDAQPPDSAASALPPPPAAWSGLQVFKGPKFAAPLGDPPPPSAPAPSGTEGQGSAPGDVAGARGSARATGHRSEAGSAPQRAAWDSAAAPPAGGQGSAPGDVAGARGSARATDHRSEAGSAPQRAAWDSAAAPHRAQAPPPVPIGPPTAGPGGVPGHPGGHGRPPVHLPAHLHARRRRGAGAALAVVVVVAAAGVALAVGRSDGGGAGGKQLGAAPQASPTASASAPSEPGASPPAATSPPASSGGAAASPLPVGERYAGIRLPAGYWLALRESPPALRPNPYDGSLGFTGRGDAFTTDPRQGTLVVLDPSLPSTLGSCAAGGSPAAGTPVVPRAMLTGGSRICVHLVDGTVALVTLRRLPLPGDPQPYAVLDVTVWRAGGRSAESDQ